MIGLQGIPLEVIGGLVDSASLLTRAQKAVDLHNYQQTPPVSQVSFRLSLDHVKWFHYKTFL